MVKIYLKHSLITIFVLMIVSLSPLSTTKLSYAQSSDGINWMDICTQLQSALYQPCSSYVNSDNTLTYDGQVALKCIKTGGVLGVGAAAVGLPLGIISKGLNLLAGPTGCGNIVNPDALNKIANINNIVNLLP